MTHQDPSVIDRDPVPDNFHLDSLIGNSYYTFCPLLVHQCG